MTVSKVYKESLLALHEGTDWGSTGGKYAGESIVKLLTEYPEIKTILDYGCGEGTLREYVEEQGITDREWTLYDPGVRGFEAKPTGTFDLVVTTDVLEHVEGFMLDAVLDELVAYSNKFVYNEIACYLSGALFTSGPYAGRDLHITLLHPDEWHKILSKLGLEEVVSRSSIIDGTKLRFLSILLKN